MRITVDTNVLISATFWDGDSSKIIGKVEADEIKLILSQEILQEYAEVLQSKEIQDKIGDKGLMLKQTVQKIASIATIVYPINKIDVVKADPDDNKVIECAVQGKVDYIITRDKHLLNLKTYDGIRIITPKELFDMLNR